MKAAKPSKGLSFRCWPEDDATSIQKTLERKLFVVLQPFEQGIEIYRLPV